MKTRLPPLWLINGIASFCLMLIQVLSGRALAPLLGTSVYTWTSVIGATLIGLTFGQAAGGYLADLNGGKKTLAQTFVLSGVSALAANFVLAFFSSRMDAFAMDIAFQSILSALFIFSPVAFFLSMVGPQLAKLSVDEIAHAGAKIGQLSAAGAVGSLLGVGLGGYILIAALGAQYLMSLVAMILLGFGFYIGLGEKIFKWNVFGFVFFASIGNWLLPTKCLEESQYFCIRIKTDKSDSAVRYTLRLDHLVHSYVNPNDPADLGYDYEQVYARLLDLRYKKEDAFHAYFIGGGGFVLPRYIASFYPMATSTVSEIDPAVIRINHERMGLAKSKNIIAESGDARRFLMRAEPSSYDIVFGDAFNDFGVPAHLTTKEFHELLKSRMKPDGVYALNLIDDSRYGYFLTSMIHTLKAVWKYVEVAPLSLGLDPGRNTIVLIASDEPIDEERWQNTNPISLTKLDLQDPMIEDSKIFLSEEDIDRLLKARKDVSVLTDDYAPLDRYLSPIFRDAK